jgi:hypothetical protein
MFEYCYFFPRPLYVKGMDEIENTPDVVLKFLDQFPENAPPELKDEEELNDEVELKDDKNKDVSSEDKKSIAEEIASGSPVYCFSSILPLFHS